MSQSINVYRVTCVENNKKYIGITQHDIRERFNGHISAASLGSTCVFHCALRKYGHENFLLELVECVDTWEIACQREIFLIESEQTHVSVGGYNSTKGGDGNLGLKHTLASKQKMSESQKKRTRKPHSEKTKQKISNAKKGKKLSLATIEKIQQTKLSRAYPKRKHTNEARKKMSLAKKDKPLTKTQSEALAKLHAKNTMPVNRKVVQFDMNGKRLATYDDANLASQKTNIDSRMIIACCEHRRANAGDYFWRFV